jgi:TonB family protein
LASDEIGDVNATGKAPVPTPGPAAGAPQPKAGEAPPPPAESESTPKPSEVARPKPVEDPSKSTAPKQDEIPKTVEELAAAGTLAPPPPPPKPAPPADTPTAKAVPKPSTVHIVPQPGGARKPTPTPDAEDHGEGHKGTIPGPDATRDEYLAYIISLVRPHEGLLSPSFIGSRRGTLALDVRISPTGHILQVFVLKSSGFPDIDERAKEMIYAVGTLSPPPPDRLLQQGVLRGTFSLGFPLAPP